MARKLLLGCAVFVALVAIAIASVVALKWNRGDTGAGTGNDEASLGHQLEKEFGGQAQVEFVCQYPVVGIGPCIPGDTGTREVTLTFTNYELPEGGAPEEQARRIATLAFKTSAFARKSKKIDVIFDEGSVSRRHSFSGQELTASDAPSSE